MKRMKVVFHPCEQSIINLPAAVGTEKGSGREKHRSIPIEMDVV